MHRVVNRRGGRGRRTENCLILGVLRLRCGDSGAPAAGFRMPRMAVTDPRGFSVIEALVAIALVTIAITSGAQLLSMSRQANQRATTIGFAAVLAQQKMEQLRALTWGFD